MPSVRQGYLLRQGLVPLDETAAVNKERSSPE